MQEGTGFNERKREILSLLQGSPMTARELSEALDGEVSPHMVSSCLYKYRNQGLVTATKHKGDKRKFVYSLTEDRGEERLEWLIEH